MASLTKFIIAMIVFSILIAGTFSPLLVDLNNNYDVIGYNKTRIDAYDKMTELTEDVEGLKNESMELRSESGILDVLGGFFESGYNAMKIAVGSFDIFYSMADQIGDDSNLSNLEVFKNGLVLIVIVVLFLGVIIAAVVKWQI